MPTSPPSITAIPDFPSISDRVTYNAKAYAWATALDTVTAGEISAVATNVYNNAVGTAADATAASSAATTASAAALTAVNAPGTSGTSTTSLTIASGTQSFTTQTGKAWSVGQPVVIARTSAPSTTLMYGVVTAYTTGTGAMVVSVNNTAGTGTFTDWTISLTGPAFATGGALIYLSTVTASAASTVDIETGFSSTYDDYLIVVSGVYSSAAAATINARLKIGGSYITTGYDGSFTYFNSTGSTETLVGNANGSSAWVAISNNGSTDSAGLCLNVFDANSSRLKTCTAIGSSIHLSTTSGFTFRAGFGCRTAGVLSGVRILPASGTISGVFKLYGIAKA